MGRKRTRFDWSADPDDPDVRVAVEREPRSVLKAELEALHALVLELVALSAADRRDLPLDADVLDGLDALAELPNGPAKKRQMQRMKRLLADVDREALQDAMAGETSRAARLREAERWRRQLLEGGDAALQALVEAYPQCDRGRMRMLLRKANGGDGPTRPLFEALVELFAA